MNKILKCDNSNWKAVEQYSGAPLYIQPSSPFPVLPVLPVPVSGPYPRQYDHLVQFIPGMEMETGQADCMFFSRSFH